MPKITYITTDKVHHEVEVDNGYSVMEGAINNNIDGIVAECGGACACATCHSYIDAAWLDKMPEMDDMEDSMLDAAFERKIDQSSNLPDRGVGQARRFDRACRRKRLLTETRFRAADDHSLDLAGAFVNLGNLCIAEVPLQR